jgi:hypothetical protein
MLSACRTQACGQTAKGTIKLSRRNLAFRQG